MLFDIDRLFNNFNLLNNTVGVFDKIKNTATVRTGIKGMSLKIIDFLRSKKKSGQRQVGSDWRLRASFRFAPAI